MYVLRGEEGNRGREKGRSCILELLQQATHTPTSSTAILKESLRDRKAFSCDSEEEEDREEELHSLTTPDLTNSRRDGIWEGGGRGRVEEGDRRGGRNGGMEGDHMTSHDH